LWLASPGHTKARCAHERWWLPHKPDSIYLRPYGRGTNHTIWGGWVLWWIPKRADELDESRSTRASSTATPSLLQCSTPGTDGSCVPCGSGYVYTLHSSHTLSLSFN
jgi:hypothetical protein